MKRFHVHVAVPNLNESIRFYSTMFGSEPSVVKPDYAKWMLDDPRVNFAISQRSTRSGVNHLGLQVDSDDELEDIHTRLRSAEANVAEEKNVSCCYARSNKYWVTDPSGVAWESFRNLRSVEFYDDKAEVNDQAGCCAPSEQTGAEKSACCA
ncbi:MAG TPA: ArsI/CadI family heavy metal resistance metalloenzyme [Casimicrobiaceae bacterium]